MISFAVYIFARRLLRVCTQNGFASKDLFRGKAACDWSGAHHVGPMPLTSTPSPADLPSPSARHLPRVRRGDGWDALADMEVFVFAVEAELEPMERERFGVPRRGRKPDLTLRRRLIGLIWTLTFGGMQWRVAGWLSGVPFTTLHSTFARWARLGLWRRLGQLLASDWRLACHDEVLPSAVVADSRSLRSAPSAWTRGIDGGKLVKGVKLWPSATSTVRCSISLCSPPTGMIVPASCRCCRTWPRSASRATCSATAASKVRPLPRRHTGRPVLAARDQVGRGAALCLAQPLSPAQHRVRPPARPLCRAHLDCDDLHHLTTARRPSQGPTRHLIAYSF